MALSGGASWRVGGDRRQYTPKRRRRGSLPPGTASSSLGVRARRGAERGRGRRVRRGGAGAAAARVRRVAHGGAGGLPASMVGAMLPRGAAVPLEEKVQAQSARRIRRASCASPRRYPFHLEIDWIRRAVTWDSPVRAGLLHVALLCVYHPRRRSRARCGRRRAPPVVNGRAAGRSPARISPRTRDLSTSAGRPRLAARRAETAAMLGADAPSELASVDIGVFSALGKRREDVDAGVTGVTDAGRALA